MRVFLAVASWAALAIPAWSADDPGARALQQHQLQRQQQEVLQLRMQQQQRSVRNPPADLREKQARDALLVGQQQQQQQLHYRQIIEPPLAQPSDDEGTRRAKAEMERLKAQRQGGQQLQRFDVEPGKKVNGDP